VLYTINKYIPFWKKLNIKRTEPYLQGRLRLDNPPEIPDKKVWFSEENI
jgi:hypothetical protein